MTEETLEALRRLLYVPDLEGVRVARLQPKDVILVEIAGKVSLQEAQNMRHQLKEVWPDHEVLVLDDGVRLRIAREVNPEAEDVEV